ncbi:hypothetical protein FND50_18290 [Rhodococcus sp. WB9]|uniref:hypothetical protein n=1 Tax=Rhodococcus sp. WB9 TaxID=2594007 RepID=UPI001186B079|nr:hypothetical protein [Rhodococcus sp. WB9]QDQ92549.1 hypothetical protein FND50_18290 [Rhodococcus sp. WB9]
MSSPSATLTVWASSWLAGNSAPDDVIDALHAWAPMHLACAEDEGTAGRTGLPWPHPQDAGVTALLQTMRRSVSQPETEIRLVLPGPGDVRGLPAGTEFASAAISAGEGVLVGPPGRSGTGLVPHVEGPDVLRWTVSTIERLPLDAHHTGLGEAEFTMRQAVRDAAAALEALHMLDSGFGADPRALIAEALAQSARHRYPATIAPRALRILDSADQVAAILTVAEQMAPARTVSASGAATLEDLLRPLRSAVRSARTAAVNACARDGLTA